MQLCDKSCLDWNEARNGRETRVSLSEPMIGDFPRIVTEGFTIPENSVHKINFVN